jgi:hypothetical protein
MKKTQPEGSEPKRGWPSKEVMAGRSGEVFSLDFPFIEQVRATEAAKRIAYQSVSAWRGPADAQRYAASKEWL